MQTKQNTPPLIALTSASLLSSIAYAQSSVTLYGFIDEGLNFTSNAGGHSAWQMSGGMIRA
ncbi:porin [Paraburkholderia azotifigens]|jgi:predicted porin|uniref:porin n=1 Tax=Paraburkholderia azotifigens TaxID=2057004 RepID=UPI0038B82404